MCAHRRVNDTGVHKKRTAQTNSQQLAKFFLDISNNKRPNIAKFVFSVLAIKKRKEKAPVVICQRNVRVHTYVHTLCVSMCAHRRVNDTGSIEKEQHKQSANNLLSFFFLDISNNKRPNIVKFVFSVLAIKKRNEKAPVVICQRNVHVHTYVHTLRVSMCAHRRVNNTGVHRKKTVQTVNNLLSFFFLS
jgi:hypothetical protein